MGTKNDPGTFDCYANAAPDEPMFILLGRDKHAPTLARLWALLRHKDGEDEAKVAEALQCATAMDAYRRALGKRRKDAVDPMIPQELFELVTKGMHEHPDDFDHPCMCDTCQSYD